MMGTQLLEPSLSASHAKKLDLIMKIGLESRRSNMGYSCPEQHLHGHITHLLPGSSSKACSDCGGRLGYTVWEERAVSGGPEEASR